MNKGSFEKELRVAQAAAKAAGRIQREYFLVKNHVVRKSPRELVSKTDLESQNVVMKVLRDAFPEYKIFTEETVNKKNYPHDELFWIVDPLDGTHNYVAGLPFYGSSIALADSNNFYIGVIYIPIFDFLFWAIKGKGAYCNNRAISTSNNSDLSKSMVAYDNQFYLSEDSFARYGIIVKNAFTTRIIGSAVYDLCLVASGRIDARIWNCTKICDIAAGMVLVKEAGGRVTDFSGNSVRLHVRDVIASNGLVHGKLTEIVNSEEARENI